MKLKLLLFSFVLICTTQVNAHNGSGSCGKNGQEITEPLAEVITTFGEIHYGRVVVGAREGLPIKTAPNAGGIVVGHVHNCEEYVYMRRTDRYFLIKTDAYETLGWISAAGVNASEEF